MKPGAIQLIDLIDLDPAHNYASMTESDAVRRNIGLKLGLSPLDPSDYCSIVEAFLNRAERLLEWIPSTVQVSKLEQRPASLNPDDFAW